MQIKDLFLPRTKFEIMMIIDEVNFEIEREILLESLRSTFGMPEQGILSKFPNDYK